MSSEHQTSAATYVGHFRSEHQKILRIENRLHQKLLVVSMIGALAEGRYPSLRGDKAKFVELIENYANWPDATSISVSQLELRIKQLRSVAGSGIRDEFVEGLAARVARWHDRRNSGEIPRIGMDPRPDDVLSPSVTETEIRLVHSMRHSVLLYRYRCKLVHEFREPGYGMEFDESDQSPFYHTMTDLDEGFETVELVYPRRWFVNLLLPILGGLESYYMDQRVDPMDSYNFGSLWD